MPTIGERLEALGVLDPEEDEEEPQTIGARLEALGLLDAEPEAQEAAPIPAAQTGLEFLLPEESEATAAGDPVTQEAAERHQRTASFLPPFLRGTPLGNVEAGLADAALGFAGIAARGTDLVTRRSEADEINRDRQLHSEIRAVLNKGTKLPDMAENAVEQAVSSISMMMAGAPAGIAGILTVFGADAANTSYTLGKDRGLTGPELKQYTAVNTLIEVGITGLFHGGGKLIKGLGGVEDLAVAREAVRSGFKAGLKQLGIGFGGEITEESTISLLNAMNDSIAFDEEFSFEKWVSDLPQLMATVGLTMGFMKGAQRRLPSPPDPALDEDTGQPEADLEAPTPVPTTRGDIAKLLGIHRDDPRLRTKEKRDEALTEFNAKETVDATTEVVAGPLDVEEGAEVEAEPQRDVPETEVAPVVEEPSTVEGEPAPAIPIETEPTTETEIQPVAEPESEVEKTERLRTNAALDLKEDVQLLETLKDTLPVNKTALEEARKASLKQLVDEGKVGSFAQDKTKKARIERLTDIIAQTEKRIPTLESKIAAQKPTISEEKLIPPKELSPEPIKTSKEQALEITDTIKQRTAVAETKETNAGRPPEQTTTETSTETSTETQTEIAEVIKTDFTEPQPETSRLTQEQILQDRADLLLDGPHSREKQRLIDLNQEALEGGEARKALGRAQVINANPTGESITPVQRIGLRHGALERKKDIQKATAKIKVLQQDELKNAAEINSLATEIARMESEFDQISQAEFTSQSQAGLLLRTSQMTLDEGFDIVTVKTRARSAKKGPLTERQSESFEDTTDNLERAEEHVVRLETALAEETAEGHRKENIRRARRPKSRITRAERVTQRDGRMAKLKQLVEDGCNA